MHAHVRTFERTPRLHTGPGVPWGWSGLVPRHPTMATCGEPQPRAEGPQQVHSLECAWAQCGVGQKRLATPVCLHSSICDTHAWARFARGEPVLEAMFTSTTSNEQTEPQACRPHQRHRKALGGWHGRGAGEAHLARKDCVGGGPTHVQSVLQDLKLKTPSFEFFLKFKKTRNCKLRFFRRILLQVLFQNGAELHVLESAFRNVTLVRARYLLSRHMLLVLRRIFCVCWEPAPSCLSSAPNSKTQAFHKVPNLG
jgi:hypothetical protein